MRVRVRWVPFLIGLFVLCSGASFGQERWVYDYNGPGNGNDGVNSVVTGEDGYLYAAGYSWGGATSFDFAVVSLTDSGTERWVYRYDGPAGDHDAAEAIIIGADGNLYCAGTSMQGGSNQDFTVVSLTDSGVERWVYRYDGPAGGTDVAYSITVDPGGNIYAAGYSSGIGTLDDFTVVSVTDSGVERWVYRYDGPANTLDRANCIVTAPDGNVCAAGWSGGIGTSDDFTVISLSDSGTERWVYRYDGPGNDYDEANSIVMDSNRNVYAAGWSSGSTTFDDLTVVSLSDSGTERWIYRYDGPASSYDEAYSLAMGSDGNLYAAGSSVENGTNQDFTVVSLTDSGTERWVYRYDGPGNDYDEANSVVMGSDGNLYAAGYTYGGVTEHDFTVVSLSPSGAERWVYRYDGPGNIDDRAHSIVMGSDGNVYAGGKIGGSGTSEDYVVVSLTRAAGIDAAVISIDSPPDTVFVDSTYGVRASVGNFGSLTATFDVVASIDGYTDTIQVQNLTPGSSTQVDFQSWQVPSPDSTVYGMTVCVHAVGDVDSTNDCAQRTTFAFGPPGVEERLSRWTVLSFAGSQNSPNPFARSTNIWYTLLLPSEVTLSIYDITGRLVETLVNETQQPGIHQVNWNRKSNPSGVYFYRLSAGESVETRKMVLID